MKKLLITLCLALAAVLLAGAPGSAAQAEGTQGDAAGQTAVRSDQRPAARAPKAKWKCTKWRGGASSYERYCARISSFKDRIRIDYRERFYNEGPEWGTLKCSHSKTTTWTFHASGTVEAEAGVIFAKAKTSITAGLARSSSTTRTTEVTYKHRPRTWAHCERGLHGYTFKGEVRKTTCRPKGCVHTIKSFKASAPEAGFWRYGSGRGGATVKP